jgi:hypothetical protein
MTSLTPGLSGLETTSYQETDTTLLGTCHSMEDLEDSKSISRLTIKLFMIPVSTFWHRT